MSVIFKLKLWSNYDITSLIAHIIGLTSRFCKLFYSDWPDTTRATVPFSVALVPFLSGLGSHSFSQREFILVLKSSKWSKITSYEVNHNITNFDLKLIVLEQLTKLTTYKTVRFNEAL